MYPANLQGFYVYYPCKFRRFVCKVYHTLLECLYLKCTLQIYKDSIGTIPANFEDLCVKCTLRIYISGTEPGINSQLFKNRCTICNRVDDPHERNKRLKKAEEVIVDNFTVN